VARAASSSSGAGGGRLLASRYRLAGRPHGTGAAALDTRSGAEVQLDAVPLPELVTPFDQDLRTGPDETEGRALTQAAFVTQTVPDHPRLSQVFEVFAEDGYLWVVGEAVAGVQLGQVLRHGPLTPYRAAELAGDLVAALRAVHAMGLVHGNLTPETVTVCEDGTALLGGLVVAVAQEALCGGPGADTPGAGVPAAPWSPARVRARDARAVIVGAVPERWAPEQAGPDPAGDRPVGPAADAWSLGALLFRMLTGEPLPLPPAPAPVAPSTDAARMLGPLRPLVKGLLDADPDVRPLLAEVQEWLRQLLVQAPEPLDQDALLTVAELLSAPRRGQLERGGRRGDLVEHPEFAHHHHAAPRRRHGRTGVLLAAGIILIVLLALLVIALVGR
jgi:serine/threonine protein kinase